ncbi:MAG: alpha-amylase family glycosyl hydrolase [Acidobacteriota bacterium]
MYFPFSREIRRRLEIAPDFIGDLAASRQLARRLDHDRQVALHPERGVRAGLLYALFELQRWSERLFDHYVHQVDGELWRRAHAWLEDRFGPRAVAAMLERFRELFGGGEPPRPQVEADGVSEPAGDDFVDLAAVLQLWLVNRNPAMADLRDLFDDQELEEATGYGAMVASLEELFVQLPPLDGESLWDHCQRPQRQVPASLRDQLELVTGFEAGTAEQASAQLLALDVLREEERPVFVHGGPPPPPPEVSLEALQEGEERFSADRRWMPELVLVAKNVLVWLHQLSQTWKRDITTLDGIPDDELDRLAERGFTGLWLIGVWQRSAASRTIKHRAGNPAAGASAYAVYAYEVADELGGEAALDDLRERAWQRGLRLACDMVPNHFGIDSDWVQRFPERFLTRPDCPFPNYTFEGPDLSSNPAVGLYLEDGYWDRSDAAVVFRRVDRQRDEVRYLYHGNDGTVTPWNDTAQLDYLQPAVQEAVIELILEVAGRFPVIRFDAAMTLAKRHIQRLWYPLPGHGGDIPSRAEFALEDEDFQRLMPEEFWRRVVDRVAEEAPDTLLLAEAFWLMESYFVRSLGMHRVYNSAFMHMLRAEENDKLHRSLEKILEFEPGILQRHVNFLSNPDEETAVEQFGQQDKYFAACVLLVTLPGLPLFGHGQWEGLSEKYGMEYRRSFRDEAPDPGLVAHHDRVITPLLARRRLFAEVEQFRLLEFATAAGHDRNVFAFVNRQGEERVVVWVHHRAGETRGRVSRSVPFVDREGEKPRRETLGEALAITPRPDRYWIFRDLVAGGERLISAQRLAEDGLEARLGSYEARVYGDFRCVRDLDGRYRELAEALDGDAVDDVESAIRRRRGSPLREPFSLLLERVLAEPEADGPELVAAMTAAYAAAALSATASRKADDAAIGGDAIGDIDAADTESAPPLGPSQEVDRVAPVGESMPPGGGDGVNRAVVRGRENLRAVNRLGAGDEATERWRSQDAGADQRALRLWAVVEPLSVIAPARGRDLLDDGLLVPVLEDLLAGTDESTVAALRLFADRRQWWQGSAPRSGPLAMVDRWIEDAAVRRLLQLHRFDGESWFRQEGYRGWMQWLVAMAAVATAANQPVPAFVGPLLEDLMAAEEPSGYRWQTLREILGAPAPTGSAQEQAVEEGEGLPSGREAAAPGDPQPGGPAEEPSADEP